MPDPVTPTTVTPNTDPVVAPPAAPPVQETQDENTLPEWARTKLTEANREAAKYRTERNDAVNTAKAAVQTEFEAKLAAAAAEHESTKGALSAKELELVKLRAALGAGIPGESAVEFATLLQGADEAEITSHAAAVKALLGKTDTKSPAYDPSQGSGNVLPLNGDPLLEMVKRVVGAK